MIAVPNLLFVSALLFAVGALTRKLFAVYVTGIILLVAWQITQQIVGQLDKLRLASLIDPFALTTVDVADPLLERRGEEHAARSARRARCCENRLIWIAIALALFAIVAAVFRLRLQAGRARAQSEGSRRSSRRSPCRAIPAVALALRPRELAARVRVGGAVSPPLDSSRAAVPRDLAHLRHQPDGRPVVSRRIPATRHAGR